MYKYLPVLALCFLTACVEVPEMLAECDSGTGKTICNLQNPEDMDFLPGSDWAVYSEMISELDPDNPVYGSIGALNLKTNQTVSLFGNKVATWADAGVAALGDESCPGKPDPARFGGHGIDVRRLNDGTILLAAVNHGDRESVELFSIDNSAEIPVAIWRGCVLLKREVIHNDVAITADGRLYITEFIANPHYANFRFIKDIFQLYFGRNTGFVYHWSKEGGLQIVANSKGSAPNGVSISKDDSSLFVAEWGEHKMYRLRFDGEQVVRDELALAIAPDNFSWRENGKLIVVGQKGDVFTIISCGEDRLTTCDIPYAVYEVDPDTLKISEIHKGTGAASVSLLFDEHLYVGTFVGDNIQVHRGVGK